MQDREQQTASTSYRDAGVDIDAGDRLVEAIKPLARRTMRPEVLGGIGGFGALTAIPGKYRNPVLVSGTDGVGTKLKLAFDLGRHDTVGIDLVAMSVNDILVQGAEPLFFLDYFACGKLDVATATSVVGGIAHGCEQAGCALIGGETAEMPGMYPDGEYDLAGFAVGVVERDAIIDGRTIVPGDAVLGLASSGVHSNGFSLVRRILARSGARFQDPLPVAGADPALTLADVLIEPTRIYVKPVLALIGTLPVKGLAHITGGGLVENVPRILGDGLCARLQADAWKRPAVFDWLEQSGPVERDEMHRVFNCGIGMVVVVARADAARALSQLTEAGVVAWDIGEIVATAPGAARTVVV